MSTPLDTALQAFHDDDYTVRLVGAVFKVIPKTPLLRPYHAPEDALFSLQQPIDPFALGRIRKHVGDPDVADVLWMGGLVDSADRGYAVLTGITSVWGMIRGNKDALDNDSQQRNDAVMKGFAIAYMAYNAFPGSIADRAQAFTRAPAGQALLTWYAAMEIALPFADNAAVAGGKLVGGLIGSHGTGAFSTLAGLAGGRSLTGVQEMFRALQGSVGTAVAAAAPYRAQIATAAKAHLPASMGTVADRAAGVVAAGADVMPVYTWLSARLAAESVAYRAIHGAPKP